jgi:hypothetical protein
VALPSYRETKPLNTISVKVPSLVGSTFTSGQYFHAPDHGLHGGEELRVVGRRLERGGIGDHTLLGDDHAHAHRDGRQVRRQQFGRVGGSFVLVERLRRDPLLAARHGVTLLVGGVDLGHRNVAGARQIHSLDSLLRGAGHEQECH